MEDLLNRENDHTRFELNQTVHKEDIKLAEKVSPQHKEYALKLIKYSLGYLPRPYAYMPHLALAQSLSENHGNGLITDQVFSEEIFALHKRIRNDAMKKGGWLRVLDLDEAGMELYDTYSGTYKHAARQRLCSLMGYEPELVYSMIAEVYLRTIFESDVYNSESHMCSLDYEAITITKYREVFITQGEEKADDSELIGLEYNSAE